MSKVKYNVWSQIEKVVDDEYEVLDMYKIVKVVDTLEEALSLQHITQRLVMTQVLRRPRKNFQLLTGLARFLLITIC